MKAQNGKSARSIIIHFLIAEMREEYCPSCANVGSVPRTVLGYRFDDHNVTPSGMWLVYPDR